MYQVKSGRLFCRRVSDGAIVLGVIEVPTFARWERMYPAIANAQGVQLALEADSPAVAASEAEAIKAYDVGSLAKALSFRRGARADGIDCFLREAALPHRDATSRWSIILAALPRTTLPDLADEGLYEIGPISVALIDADPRHGEALQSILRVPLCSSDRYGLTTSMEPNTYPVWLAQERARLRASPNADQEYLRFVDAIASRSTLQMAYTSSELERHERIVAEVIRDLRDVEETTALAHRPRG